MNAVMELPRTDIAVIAEKIDMGLQAFEKRKAELTELQQEAHGLKITSIEDKNSINYVSTIRKRLKSARVEIEKEGKSMRDPLTQISKKISEKEKELVAIIEPTEKELMVQEKWVDDEKAKIEQAKIDAENKLIQDRIDALAAYGYSIDYEFIKAISDEDFAKVLDNAKIEHERELAAKAEHARLEEEERQRIIAERKELEELRAKQAEQQRIIDEQNEKIRKDQEEKEAAIRAEQKRIEDERRELEKKKINQRCDQLSALGMKFMFQSNAYEFGGVVHVDNPTEICLLDDAEWNALIEKITPVIEQRKKFLEDQRFAELQKEKEAAEELKKQEDAERIAQASDKVKFQTVINQLGEIKIPEMKSAKSKKLALEVNELLTKVVSHIISNLK